MKTEIKNAVTDWKTLLVRDHKGNIENVAQNYIVFLNDSEFYKGRLKLNEFTCRPEIDGREMNDTDLAQIRVDFSNHCTFKTRQLIDDCLAVTLKNNSYHPIKKYLESLEWDGVNRVDTLFIDYLGVEDTELHRTQTRLWFTAAIKRIYEPGCKFDSIIVLKGPSDIGKTKIFEQIFRDKITSDINIDDKDDAVDKMKNNWVCTFDEGIGLTRKENSAIKNFITQSVFDSRKKYGRLSEKYKSHNVFVSSTNDDYIINDYSVDYVRRYWIMECTKEKRDKFIESYDDFGGWLGDQILAEAYHIYNNNKEKSLMLSNDLIDIMKAEQEQYKTISSDDVYAEIDAMLNAKYNLNDGEFKSVDDFIEQVKMSNVSLGSSYINKLPMSYLKAWITYKNYDSRHRSIINRYLDENDWKRTHNSIKYKSINNNNKAITGISRKYNKCDEISTTNNELPF